MFYLFVNTAYDVDNIYSLYSIANIFKCVYSSIKLLIIQFYIQFDAWKNKMSKQQISTYQDISVQQYIYIYIYICIKNMFYRGIMNFIYFNWLNRIAVLSEQALFGLVVLFVK